MADRQPPVLYRGGPLDGQPVAYHTGGWTLYQRLLHLLGLLPPGVGEGWSLYRDDRGRPIAPERGDREWSGARRRHYRRTEAEPGSLAGGQDGGLVFLHASLADSWAGAVW
jgi:hypothetical protein